MNTTEMNVEMLRKNVNANDMAKVIQKSHVYPNYKRMPPPMSCD